MAKIDNGIFIIRNSPIYTKLADKIPPFTLEILSNVFANEREQPSYKQQTTKHRTFCLPRIKKMLSFWSVYKNKEGHTSPFGESEE